MEVDNGSLQDEFPGKSRGLCLTQPQTMRFLAQIPQIYHTFALFHPPNKNGNFTDQPAVSKVVE